MGSLWNAAHRDRLRNRLARLTPDRQLIIYVLPWPRGAPTSPELLTRIDRAQFQHEQDATPDLLEKLGSLHSGAQMPEHPGFGHLSRRVWGFLGYRHVDHHFKQFGV